MTWKCTYWQRYGVKGPFGLPLVGSMLRYVMAREHYGDVYQNIYKYVQNNYGILKCDFNSHNQTWVCVIKGSCVLMFSCLILSCLVLNCLGLSSEYHNLPYIGIYRLFNEPCILLRSSEMLKTVMIRSFQHFQDNVLWVDAKREPVAMCNPFLAKGDKWRNMRNEIVPIFTPNKVSMRVTLCK